MRPHLLFRFRCLTDPAALFSLYKRELFLLLLLFLFPTITDRRTPSISITSSQRRTHSVYPLTHPLPVSRTQHPYTPSILESTHKQNILRRKRSITKPQSRCQTKHNLHPAPKHLVGVATFPQRVETMNACQARHADTPTPFLTTHHRSPAEYLRGSFKRRKRKPRRRKPRPRPHRGVENRRPNLGRCYGSQWSEPENG